MERAGAGKGEEACEIQGTGGIEFENNYETIREFSIFDFRFLRNGLRMRRERRRFGLRLEIFGLDRV
jgi:hypothetical protein